MVRLRNMMGSLHSSWAVLGCRRGRTQAETSEESTHELKLF